MICYSQTLFHKQKQKTSYQVLRIWCNEDPFQVVDNNIGGGPETQDTLLDSLNSFNGHGICCSTITNNFCLTPKQQNSRPNYQFATPSTAGSCERNQPPKLATVGLCMP